jgi:5-methylcytosine-specific restriction protein A
MRQWSCFSHHHDQSHTIMSIITELKPTQPLRTMDLVNEAGVDVSDWKNFKGGEKQAARNPKYCYEWAFVQPAKVVVLSLWHANLIDEKGSIVQRLNYQAHENKLREHGDFTGATRSKRADAAIRIAVEDQLPVRVIINEGKRRDLAKNEKEPSKVKFRLLDPVAWGVEEYNGKTGASLLVRGSAISKFADQFELHGPLEVPVSKKTVKGDVYSRSPLVRQKVLERANGICEYCLEPGFVLVDGRLYLETHHIIPLSEKGPDSEANVIALCPNHHKEAHFGGNWAAMREAMLKIVKSKLSSSGAKRKSK